MFSYCSSYFFLILQDGSCNVNTNIIDLVECHNNNDDTFMENKLMKNQ